MWRAVLNEIMSLAHASMCAPIWVHTREIVLTSVRYTDLEVAKLLPAQREHLLLLDGFARPLLVALKDGETVLPMAQKQIRVGICTYVEQSMNKKLCWR